MHPGSMCGQDGPERASTSEAPRSVPSSPHGSSCSTRPGWAAFGGEERPASAQVRGHAPPVLLGAKRGMRGNPFANAREERSGNPFEKR